MAKQFGVSDAALRGLEDPGSHAFPPDERVALLLADSMTRGSGEIPDSLFDELRRHFDERQIVEIAAVIGLFNYFNRFNNAFHVDITLMDPDVLAHRVEQAVASAASPGAVCDQAADLLQRGRRYLRVAVYRRDEKGWVRVGGSGSEAPERYAAGGAVEGPPRLAASRSALAVPVVHRGVVAGLVAAESDRADAFGDEDRHTMERVAALIAPRLAPAV